MEEGKEGRPQWKRKLGYFTPKGRVKMLQQWIEMKKEKQRKYKFLADKVGDEIYKMQEEALKILKQIEEEEEQVSEEESD